MYQFTQNRLGIGPGQGTSAHNQSVPVAGGNQLTRSSYPYSWQAHQHHSPNYGGSSAPQYFQSQQPVLGPHHPQHNNHQQPTQQSQHGFENQGGYYYNHQYYHQNQNPQYQNGPPVYSPQPHYNPPSHSSALSYSAPVAKASPEPCYNCGERGHWAQNCPEPRRALPAGEINRPRKRQKTYGPPLTCHNSVQAPHQSTLQRGWTHPLPNYQSCQYQTSPPTPNSSTSQPCSQWQPQWQPTQAVFGPQNQTQTQKPTGLPTPNSYFDSQYSSPTSAPINPPENPFHKYQKPSGSPLGLDQETVSSVQSTQNEVTVKESKSKDRSGRDSVEQRHDDKLQLPTEDDVDGLLEELQALHDQEKALPLTSEPATEVGQPLPSTMMEADNVCPLPSAKALPSGSKTSKYLLTENDKSYTLPANERDDWSEVQSDPVFAKIPAKCETFTFDALRARRDAMAAIPEDRENKQISSTDQKPHKLYPTDQRIAQTVDADESGNSSLSREQEDRLAALGVTGTAKPVQNSLRPFQAPHTSYGIHAPIAIPSEQPNRKRSYDAMSYETPRTPRFSEKATSDRDGCTKPEIDHTYHDQR